MYLFWFLPLSELDAAEPHGPVAGGLPVPVPPGLHPLHPHRALPPLLLHVGHSQHGNTLLLDQALQNKVEPTTHKQCSSFAIPNVKKLRNC
jgi:hypothetical protein